MLHSLAIFWSVPVVWGLLWIFWRLMLELVGCCWDVVGYRHIICSVYVVLLQDETQLFRLFPICRPRVQYLQGISEVFCILTDCVLHPKTIHHKSEDYDIRGVFPHHRGMAHWFTTKSFQFFSQEVIGKCSTLLQARHYFFNLDIYPDVVYNGSQVIFIDNLLRY